MRHGKKFNHLSRKTAHRKAMLSNMACSLIEHKSINTTIAKAKALRVYVEPILTKSKTDSTHSRRLVFSSLQSKEAVSQLFKDVAPKIANRPGGYTRIIRTGYRLGDNAEMCMIELVDFNELYTNEKAKKTTRRSRRGGGADKAQTNQNLVEASTEEVAEETKTEEVVDAAPEVAEEAKTEEVVDAVPEAVEETKTEEVVDAAPEVAEEAKTEEVVDAAPEAVEEAKTEEVVDAAPEAVEEAKTEEVVDAAPEVAEETKTEETSDQVEETGPEANEEKENNTDSDATDTEKEK